MEQAQRVLKKAREDKAYEEENDVEFGKDDEEMEETEGIEGEGEGEEAEGGGGGEEAEGGDGDEGDGNGDTTGKALGSRRSVAGQPPQSHREVSLRLVCFNLNFVCTLWDDTLTCLDRTISHDLAA